MENNINIDRTIHSIENFDETTEITMDNIECVLSQHQWQQLLIVFKLAHLSRYLSITVYMLLTVIEFIRLYLGKYGNLSCRVPELAGFLMLTVLMQMPLVSFFLFNPYLLSTPTEIVLHASLWFTTIAEVVYCFLALKQASSVAKNTYISRSRDLGRIK